VAIVQPARYCDRCGSRLARDNRDNRWSACRHPARDTLLGPPDVSRAFWDTDQMRDALATWHMGRVIYAYRTHPWHARPLSQETVGNWLGLTQAQLSRIENGRAPEELSKLIRYAQILGISGELLWFKLPDDGVSEPVSPASSGCRLPVMVNGQSVLLPIDIEAAKASGLNRLLNGLTTDGKAAQRADAMALSLPVSASVQSWTVSDLDELEHVAAALDDARHYLDGSVVEYFRQQLDRSKADDGDLGSARALPLVLGILGAISQHVREVRPDVRRGLLSVGADGAEFAGWLYRDLQDVPSATYWYDRAMEWAQEAHDTAMQGYVLLRKSQMAYDLRDAHRVVTFAEAAQHGPWHFPPKVRAEVVQQAALGMAMIGEPLSVVEGQMETARELLADGTPADEQVGPGSAYFTLDTLTLRQATCYTEAGKPAQGAALFADVLATGKLSRRDAGFFGARRAAALALSGEPDEAAQIGLMAVEIAKETHSERTTRLLCDVVRTLTPWSSRPGPRTLREAVSTRP
jgi:transcriptional regulator with XRE-family HTH domain